MFNCAHIPKTYCRWLFCGKSCRERVINQNEFWKEQSRCSCMCLMTLKSCAVCFLCLECFLVLVQFSSWFTLQLFNSHLGATCHSFSRSLSLSNSPFRQNCMTDWDVWVKCKTNRLCFLFNCSSEAHVIHNWAGVTQQYSFCKHHSDDV